MLEALENSVSYYPESNGRFLQVSGITFAFNPTNEKGSSVGQCSVCVQGKPLQLTEVSILKK